MKYFFCLFALCLSLHSCSVDSSVPDDYNHQGKWDLVRTRSNMANEEYNEHPSISESYIFKNNGTFEKIRRQGISEEIAEGTYKLVQRPWTGAGEPLLFLDLKFNSESPLIANCSIEPVEHLIITSEFLLTNTWIMCDGFTMEYEKAEPADA